MTNPKEIKILEAVFEQACKVIEVDSFCAALYDRVSVKLDFPVVATKSNGALKRLPVGGTPISSHPYRPSDRLPDYLLANNQHLLIPDHFVAWAEENHLQYEPVMDTLPHTWLGVPLVSRGRAIGGVIVESTRDNAFDEKAVRILSAMANQASAALANARLIESLRIVNQVGQTLTSEVSLSVEGILTLIYEQLSLLMNTNDMYVALYDLGTQMLSFPFAMVNGEREDWSSVSRKVEGIQGLTEAVLLDPKLKPLNPSDVAQWYEDKGVKPRDERIPKSWIGIPLVSGDKIIGIISLQNDEVVRLYRDDDVEILQSMARQAAVALANTRLIERLNVVNEVGQTLAAGIELNLDEILTRVYDQVSRVMDTRNMYIAIYDQDTKELSFPFAMYNGQRELDWPSRKVESVQGLTEEVLLDPGLKPLNPPDVAQWYKEKGIKPKVTPVPKSWVGVPMISGNRILGILALQNDEVANLYDDNDIEVLKTLAGQAAIAFDNAKLFSMLKSTREKLVDAERVLVMTRFATDFIHQVNNLVGTIPIWKQQIEDRLKELNFGDAEIDRYLNKIISDVRRVRGVTTKLVSSSTQRPPVEEVNIVEIIQVIANRIRTMTPDTINTVEEYPPQSVLVKAVRIELETTFWDIAWNGIQAILPIQTGTLTLKVEPVDLPDQCPETLIEIHDDGVGVRQGMQLFTPLSSTKDGIGYGLWRARKVVEELGGTIDYQSVPGDTTFWIKLPRIS